MSQPLDPLVPMGIGMGFDGSRNDHKVVVIRSPSPEVPFPPKGVYSLNTGFWKMVAFVAPAGVAIKDYGCAGFSVFLHGNCHRRRVILDDQDSERDCVIVFNATKEVLSYLDRLQLDRPWQVALATYSDELLAIYIDRCELWVMEEYGNAKSWSKRCSICIGIRAWWPWNIHLERNGELIIRDIDVVQYIHSGFDHQRNDQKVVGMGETSDNVPFPPAEVYSLNTRRWKTVASVAPVEGVSLSFSMAILTGWGI
ncbi:hypothetical protein Droror1_Dr00001903 [Drosera rotundifolia]